MNTHQLKCFITLTQTLNFSEAARQYGITQPAFSHVIMQLEKQLGVTLFVRNKKQVALSEAGQIFLPNALKMIHIADQAKFQVQHLRIEKSSRISILAQASSSKILMECLSVFLQRHPQVFVDVSFISCGDVMSEPCMTKYDLYFVSRAMVPAGAKFELLLSGVDHLCVAFPKDHPMANDTLDFKALAAEKFIMYSKADAPLLYNAVQHICETRGITPNVICQYNRVESVLLSVSAGIGVAIVRKWHHIQ